MTDQPDTATYRRALDSTGWHHYDADDWRRIVDALDATRAERDKYDYDRHAMEQDYILARDRAEAAEAERDYERKQKEYQYNLRVTMRAISDDHLARAEAAEDDLTIAVRALDAAEVDYRLMEVAEQNRSEQLAATEAELRAAHQVLAIARNWRDQERTQPPTVGQILLFMAIAEHDAGRTA